MQLAREAGEIVVGEVVRQTEGADMPAECFDKDGGNTCTIARVCRLHGVLQEAADAFHAVLDMSKAKKVYMRNAAYMVAIDRVSKAMKLRGWV